MKRLRNLGAATLAAASLAAGVPAPTAAPNATVQEQSRERQQAPVPVSAAAMMVAQELGGGFYGYGARREPIWVGYPRGSSRSAGFPFRRVRGTRWA